MYNKKIILGMLLSTVAIAVIGVLALGSPSSGAPVVKGSQDATAYTLDPTSYDWGKIPFAGEIATKTFRIKNKGTDTLSLYNVRTSCHCTTAQLIVGDQKSPIFGMSGVSSWISEVNPGQEASLLVKFDQRYHGPQGVGPISRYVSVETNDKDLPKITFSLTGIVEK